jgi:hypothetical protein
MLRYLIEKEFKQIKRDFILPKLILLFPFIALILLPYAANFEFKDIRVVVVDKAMAKTYKFIKEGELLDEKLVNLLTKEQQDIVNSINRRTEFKVTKTTYNLY